MASRSKRKVNPLTAPTPAANRYDFRCWPDSEVAERPDDVRFLGYSGLVVLTASLSKSDPEPTSRACVSAPLVEYVCGTRCHRLDHSGLIPASLMIGAHFSLSDVSHAASSA
jgi:hypothetical protein